MAFDRAKEVFTEDFEHHTHMSIVAAFVKRVVEERDDIESDLCIHKQDMMAGLD
jgi:hypothetical protein